jgi:hypothetical protein
MNMTFILKKIVRTIIPSLTIILALCFLAQSCFLFPPIKPPDKPDTTVVVTPPFTPTLVWVNPTSGVVMDIYPSGNIFSVGDTKSNLFYTSFLSVYNPEGTLLSSGSSPSIDAGLIREVITDDVSIKLMEYSSSNNKNYRSRLELGRTIAVQYTNAYTRYNTVSGTPDTEPYPWSGYISVVGPNIAKGPSVPDSTVFVNFTERYKSPSIWMVGTFTDNFGISQRSVLPTFGQADCFVVRCFKYENPVYLQWGGLGNDLAYDVASDNIGNATIFLRAGSDFGITSATQSLVRMKTGYNIVRLDTNGLLTETFPVSLEAMGELTDTQIALGKSGTVYILAKDNVRAQYFLAKVSRFGTVWTHYFPTGVASTWLPGYGREPRMGLTTDSKENAYVTGIFTGAVNLGDTTLTTPSSEAFVAKYTPTNKCEWAVKMGVGMGVTVRLSPDETALYVNGWASGRIMGTAIPDQSDIRNGVIRPGAFLVKLKLTK